MQILGVRVDNLNRDQIFDKIFDFINSSKQCKIFTPNPEMLVDAQSDQYFKEVLNGGDINICDGMGIALFSGENIKRITGIDLMLDLCKLSVQNKWRIFLLGARKKDQETTKKVLRGTQKNLRKMFNGIRIVGKNGGPEFKKNCQSKLVVSDTDNLILLNKISQLKPDIIFVAFGHGKQEKWIVENISKIPSLKIAMGVGGAFDYISHNIKRAPQFMRTIGLEWFFRLLVEPFRIKRVFKATVMFFCYLLKEKITS